MSKTLKRNEDYLITQSDGSIVAQSPYKDMFGAVDSAAIDPRILDSMRDLMNAKEELGRMSNKPILTIDEIVQADRAIQHKIDVLQAERKEYKKRLEFIEKLPFRDGDAAFHRTHGNVLVAGVLINETSENSSYSILLKTGKRTQVPIADLLPISEATKVLYGR